ncbi:MAG: cytochrome B5, partial [Desulfuromonadales bacterium]|nr:cytochrome B5 [Desulfuromonadales bacterium]NIS42515.1 cytochrome B5 [Desulfuromonadales bacterium]
GQECSVCHLDPAGGGELTPAGVGYAYSLGTVAVPDSTDKPIPGKLFRLLVGYLHILFAFFWFGTILYVHLILKPAYASRGLPRGEVRLGLAS